MMQSIEEFIDKEFYNIAQMQLKIPDQPIYHYTDFAGLKGILNEKCLYMTESQYLNDPKEAVHGFDVLMEFIESFKFENSSKNPESEDDDVIFFFKETVKKIKDKKSIDDSYYFIASFCSNNDLLSQWRAYAKKGLGVSIGFNVEYINKICNENHFLIGNVQYENVEKKRDFLLLLKDFYDIADMHSTVLKNEKIMKIFSKIMIYLTIFHKHEFFKEEKEYRIMSDRKIHMEEVHYRSCDDKLIPYLKFPFSEDLKEIKTITAGPALDFKALKRSIHLKYPGIEVLESKGALQ